MGFKSWETPQEFFAALNEEFSFTLDAAASHKNALCRLYYTPEGLFSKSDGAYTTENYGDDGLRGAWAGHRVFCNPPYDSSLSRWVAKAAFATQREAEVAVLLLPPSIDTAWFHDFIWDERIDGSRNYCEIRFLRGRLKFWHPALRAGFKLVDHGKQGDSIFDFSLPHVPGPAPRAGNMLVIFRR